jgi:hypothetical protein
VESGFKRLAGILAAALFTYGVVGCGQDTANQSKVADAQVTVEAQAVDHVKGIERALGPADVTTFGGSDKLPIGGPLASISIPQSGDERKFIADFGCVDEVDCYGSEKFDRYVISTYPDIARIRFKTPPELADDDKSDVASIKQNFRRSLYFAKLIKLANGETLFDLLTKCSKSISPSNSAEVIWGDARNKATFAIQYFPVLRQKATGDEFELNVLLTRTGDKIEARSPAFSSSILRDADFMDRHGVSCWRAR